MSVIVREKNRRTGVEEVFVEGYIRAISLKKFDKPKIFQPAGGSRVEHTHSASLLVNEINGEENVWVRLGDIKLNPKFEFLQIMGKDKEFIAIEKGMQVSIAVKESVNENTNITYYNSSKSKILITSDEKINFSSSYKPNNTNSSSNEGSDVKSKPNSNSSTIDKGKKVYGEIVALEGNIASVKEEATKQVQKVQLTDQQVEVGGRLTAIVNDKGEILSNFKFYPEKKKAPARDNLGAVTGNAINAAYNLLKGKKHTEQDVHKLIEWFANYTFNKAKDYAADNPSFTDYEVGATIGQATLIAANQCKTTEEIDPFVTQYLSNIVPFATQTVKDIREGKKELVTPQSEEQPKEAPKGDPEPKTEKRSSKEKKVTEKPSQEAEPEETESNSDSFEFDDDLPF